MSASFRLQWCEGVSASVSGDDEVIVESPTSRVRLRPESAAARDAMLSFAPPGADEDDLAQRVEDGNGGLSRWYYHLAFLTQRRLVCYRLYSDGKLLATLLPIGESFVSASAHLLASESYVLSRFAYLHRNGATAVLESPLAQAKVMLDDTRAVAVAAQFTAPLTIQDLVDRQSGLTIAAVQGVAVLLLRAGMLVRVRADSSAAEDDDPSLQTWAFHDLLFHARSRKGRTDLGYGGTYRFAGRIAPPAAFKEVPLGPVIELFKPDLAQLMREDPPLACVQEERRSIRSFNADRPITARQLGEFLFRTGRIRDEHPVEVPIPAGSVAVTLVSRPYPSGGSLYELEIYLAVRKCDGLSEGLYYYEARRHQLIFIRPQNTEVLALLNDAMLSASVEPGEMQVLILLAARFSRLAWKYESIAYALVLKHVGVLYQTMYLAATAMGLAACALGGGDSELFARAAGTRYCDETSVGEFLLGSAKSA